MEPKKVILFCGSAGGLNVFFDFIKNIGLQKDIAIVALFHRALSEKEYLDNVLTKYTEMEVTPIEHNIKMKAGGIYIAPGGYHLLLNQDFSFALDVSEKIHYCRPSADVSLESFSFVLKEKLIALIVSGSNQDGADGAKIAQKRAAKIIIQNPLEAEYKQMPAAALKAVGNEAIVKKTNKLVQTVLDLI